MKHFPIITTNGVSEPLYDWKGLKRVREVNGERSISLTVLDTERNKHVFDLIQEESVIEYKGIQYRIKQLYKKSSGKKSIKIFKAYHRIFSLIDHQVYSTTSGAKQLSELLDMIFAGTPYTYVVIGSFSSVEFENFGNANALALLQIILKRFKVEFSIDGTFLTFKEKIGNSSDFQFRYKHNTKAVNASVNTNNLSTYIKGYGKGVEAEYTSPNASLFPNPDSADGLRHADPVRDDRYTTQAGLLERLKDEIIDEPELSITLDFADLRAAGYPYEVPNDGDEVYLIHEPLKLDLKTRIMRIEEDEDQKGNIIRSLVTLANFYKTSTDVFADLGNTQKRVNDLFEGTIKIPYNVLDDMVLRATEALQSAQTELEFINGIIARDKEDPNFLVLFNSSGIGVSTDGGQTFRTAMTAEGFIADLIAVGTMLFDRLRGGTLKLGGYLNGDGELVILDENETEAIANFNRNGGFIANLSVENFINDQVVYRNKDTKYYYVDPLNGDDNNNGADWANAKKTVMSVIENLPKYNMGLITIYVHYDNGRNVNENIHLESFHGQGDIVIDFQTTNNKLNGYIYLRGNTNFISIRNVTMSTTDARNSAIEADRCSLVDLRYVKVYGNNLTPYAFHGIASKVMLYNCDMYDVTYDGIRAGHLADMWFQNCAGLAGSSGLVAVDGGVIRGNGFAPGGNSYGIYESRGGDVVGTFTVNLGAATPPPAPDTTQEFTADSGMNWDVGGNFWDNIDLYPRQGNYGYGRKSGFWFFGTKLDVLVGKTIKSMSVYVQRRSKGGIYDPAPIQVRWHAHKSKPTIPADEDLSSEYVQINLNAGYGGWVTIPSSWFPYFQNGSAKGIGCYIASDAKTDYANLEVGAKVKVTYS